MITGYRGGVTREVKGQGDHWGIGVGEVKG